MIDTDPGLGRPGADIDDGLAIALALHSPEVTVEALTIVNGNVDVETGAANARDLLARLGGADVPVIVGAGKPAVQDMRPIRELFSRHLGSGDVPRADPEGGDAAARRLVELVLGAPGEITVVAIGPMTNLAAAIALDPGFADAVAELVLMAGSATTYAQNITPVADFNAFVDPESLQAVLDSGARIRMVGLDQTSRILLTRSDAGRLRAHGGAFAVYAAECAEAWIDFLGAAFPERDEHRDACFLHDPLTLASVIAPELLRWEPAHVSVELRGELTRGLVVADRGLALAPPAGPPNAEVAVGCDVDGFRELFLARVAGPH